MTRRFNAMTAAMVLVLAMAVATPVWGFGWGCYHKSEKEWDKCMKGVKTPKKPTAEDVEKIREARLKCTKQSEKFLLKCREKKMKLKEGKTIEELKEAMSAKYVKQMDCQIDCSVDCDKKTGFDPKTNTDVNVMIETIQCAKKCKEEKCDMDAVEIKIMEEFISKEK